MAQPTETADKDGKHDQHDKAGQLAALVIEYRESAGYSQREFSVLASVSRSTLSRIEKGELFPSGRVRRKLAKAMNVSPADLWRPGETS